MWQKIRKITCPKCGCEECREVICIPGDNHYDPPEEHYIECAVCGCFDEEDLEDEV